MENNKIILSVGQMRQIARHEITFKDILGNDTFEDGAISCPDTYSFTLDDLHQAIKRLSAANPTILEFGEYWFYPITLLSEAFCLDRACGWESDCDDVPQSMKGYPGLIVSESSFFQERWLQLEIAWEEGEADSRLSEVLDFDAILADFDRYLGNKGKPIEEWVFPEEEMETYIRFFNNDKFIAKAEEAKAEEPMDEPKEEDAQERMEEEWAAALEALEMEPKSKKKSMKKSGDKKKKKKKKNAKPDDKRKEL